MAFLWKIAQEHTDSLTLDHSRIPDHNIAYTYMSNHRDIILDSGFLSILLIDEGMDTVEIAIGDNLLIYPWIKKLVRVNKSFYRSACTDYEADVGKFVGANVALYASYYFAEETINMDCPT